MTGKTIKLLQKLIRINSENPPGREQEIAEFVAAWLREKGFKPRLKAYAPYRPNVLCRLPSRKRRKTILLSPHLDTVPAGSGWRENPFAGTIKARKIFGRGASDCKVNLAVALAVMDEIKQEGGLENLDVLLAATSDEESGSQFGFAPLARDLPALDYALILDGCDFEIVIGQKGVLHLELEFWGKKAHAAYPEKGINAIEKAAKFIIKMQKTVKAKRKKYPQLTFNCGKIQGGEKVNIVPDLCILQLDFRLPFSWQKKDAVRLVEKTLSQAPLRANKKILAYQRPAQTAKDSLLVKTLQASLRKYKLPARPKTIAGATVMTFLPPALPVAVFGFGHCQLEHMNDEYVRATNVKLGQKILKDFLKRLDKNLNDSAR